jgi:hypothetical protein
MKFLEKTEAFNLDTTKQMLLKLPKKCMCSLCTQTKKLLKEQLGTKKFNTLCEKNKILVG